MKKMVLAVLLFFAFIVLACTPKIAKSTSASTSTVSTIQVDAAKTKYPDATMDVLKKGYTIYFGVCTNCHEAKKITDFTTEELPGIIDHMARKAKISAEEKDAVLKYVMGVRLASM
jgi:uncharacterized membrane protein